MNTTVPYRKQPAYMLGFVAIVLVVCVFTAFLLWDLHKRELSRSSNVTSSLTKMYSTQTQRFLDRAFLVLGNVQDKLETPYGSRLAPDSYEVHLLLATRILEMSQLSDILLVDRSGLVVNSSVAVPSSQVSVAEQRFFRQISADRSLVSFLAHPERDPVSKHWMLHLARALRDSEGRLQGILVGRIEASVFENYYSSLKFDYARPVSLYYADGSLIASTPHREDQIGDFAAELSTIPLSSLDGNMQVYAHLKDVNEQEKFTLKRVNNYPLLLSVIDDEEEALASWRETALPIVIGAFSINVFICIMALLMMAVRGKEQRLQERYSEANERYHRTLDSMMDAIVAVDSDFRIVIFNPAAEMIFGWRASQVLGMPLDILLPERYRAAHHAHMQHFSRATEGAYAKRVQMGIIGLHADGREFPMDSTISYMRFNGKLQMTAVLRDVTDKVKSEQELVAANQQLRGLTSALQSIRESERSRIARELHDDLGQQLTGLKLDLSWLGNRIKEGKLPEIERFDASRRQLDHAIASVRRISTDLRPVVLDELGLSAAIGWLVQELERRSELSITANLPQQELVLDKALAVGLFRIVQEALTNIVRHAAASAIQINLTLQQDRVRLDIADDGKGFDTEVLRSGFGLVSMRERTKELGGWFNIESQPGRGTTISVELTGTPQEN